MVSEKPMIGADEFCEHEFAWTLKIEWTRGVGIVDLGSQRFARICISHSYGVGYYDEFRVEIIDPFQGRIDAQTYRFRDFDLGCSKPKDFPRHLHAHILDSGKMDWYIKRPETTQPVVDAVEKYIRRFTGTR